MRWRGKGRSALVKGMLVPSCRHKGGMGQCVHACGFEKGSGHAWKRCKRAAEGVVGHPAAGKQEGARWALTRSRVPTGGGGV